jgi:hypothetical protein
VTTPSPNDSDRRVLSFRRRGTLPAHHPPQPSPVEDLGRYERPPDDGPDDYRHRMITNGLAAIAVVLLVAAGWWIADTMAQMRKNQDCVLSGRRGCTPVPVETPIPPMR